ncbi:protein rapunzel-like isoform X1 [Pseudorasbora parva]|uniref:protein rapunzel-like isoform X1 n=1 Tax=Pseudorasbora parva TaxID=51549 RepID=UPI00351E82EC
MNRVEEWVLENKDKIEKGVEIMGQGCEVLAATVGQFHPILEAVFLASAEILGNPDGKEAKFLAEQFEKINQKLEGINNEIDQIALELQRTSMNKQNFDREAKIISQYEKFQDFVNAKPKFKEKKKEKFISQYENTDRDLNIDALYNAVTGENISGDAILDTMVTTEQRSRKPVEEFCARLKKIFVMGIIAVMGHAALKEGAVGEAMVKKWQDRMEDVETRMKAAVDDCIENFPVQAKTDVELQLQERQASVDPEFAGFILDLLEKKYYWVSWSVRVFNHSGIFFWNWLAGKKYHGSGGGGNYFDLLTSNSIRIVVSFSRDPKPLNKSQLLDQIEAQKLKGNMQSVAQELWKTLPDTLVHAISCYKKVEEKNNFQPECIYFARHKKAYLCIHSE